MLKGLVFDLQTFTANAFALFIDKFLNRQSGVATGCLLSNTNTSVTIGEGYFVIRGRFLRVISGETISDINTDGFYKLVCEIDLSKTNTIDEFKQGNIKVVYGASDYPTLTQQDIVEGNGTVYQYEFARFKVESGSITDFTDKRTFVSYGQILTLVQNELEALEQQSNVSLKSDFAVVNAVVPTYPAGYPKDSQRGELEIDYPAGFTDQNCVVLTQAYASQGSTTHYTVCYGNVFNGWCLDTMLRPQDISISVFHPNPIGDYGEVYNLNVRLVLMKIS